MSMFNFKDKQRLHTQLVGETTGKELFHVDEYNQRKRTTLALVLALVGIFTLMYFCWKMIPMKITVFIILAFVGLATYLYFNCKQQFRLRERLY